MTSARPLPARRPWPRLAIATTAIVVVPAVAQASNMTHPRTPVVWEDVPCLTLHDRSDGAMMNVPYTIPKEDTNITPDEVANSRTHQFFAFCRPRHPQNYLPNWITQTDVDEAAAVGLIEKGLEPSDILETASQWTDCWFRINEDAERRPITYEMADAGVDWDTSAVSAGVYTLYGYTYEPVFNVWHTRPGVVKVHDGDPYAVGPAGAIAIADVDDTTPYRDEEIELPACAHAIDGSTYTLYWALTDADPDWVEYAPAVEIPGEAFSVAFTPPEGLWGESGMLRLDITEPGGDVYTAYVGANIVTINADDPNACDAGGGFIGSPCEDSSGGSDNAGSGDEAATGMSGTTGDSGDSAPGDDTANSAPGQTDGNSPSPNGCGCRSGDAADASGLAMGSLLLLGAWRRRRRLP